MNSQYEFVKFVPYTFLCLLFSYSFCQFCSIWILRLQHTRRRTLSNTHSHRAICFSIIRSFIRFSIFIRLYIFGCSHNYLHELNVSGEPAKCAIRIFIELILWIRHLWLCRTSRVRLSYSIEADDPIYPLVRLYETRKREKHVQIDIRENRIGARFCFH